jgi:hypothetical protein
MEGNARLGGILLGFSPVKVERRLSSHGISGKKGIRAVKNVFFFRVVFGSAGAVRAVVTRGRIRGSASSSIHGQLNGR